MNFLPFLERPSLKVDPWKITPDCSSIFPILCLGEHSRVPPSNRIYIHIYIYPHIYIYIYIYPVASPGCFFRGNARPFKGYHARPAGGPGANASPDGSEILFLKTIQSIRKWIHFSKITKFFLPKESIFLRNLSKSGKEFTKIFEFFRKIILDFSIFMILYKSREIPCEFYYLVEKLIKKRKNS